ncbi:hypothetical protein [Singulisphaera sp. PoT]|uniref:hypothetical protein n=1 Tax=Singulisphaera sp. PoT TaxID=3411797 RepID=UPI003BF49A73
MHGIERYRDATDLYFENLEGDPHAFEDDPYIEDMACDFSHSADSLVNLILASEPEIRVHAITHGVDPIKGIWPARGIVHDGHLYIAAADHADRVTLMADPSRRGETERELDRMQLLVIPLSSIVDLDAPSAQGGELGHEEGANGARQGDPSPAGDVEAIFVAPVPSLA